MDLGQGRNGQVVGIIQERRYRTDYSASDWDYLEKGILIRTDFGDLTLEEPDEDLDLVSGNPRD